MPDGDIFVLKSGILDGDSKSDTVHCFLWSVSRDSYTLLGWMIKRHIYMLMYLLVEKSLVKVLKNIRWCYDYHISVNNINWIIYICE